MNHFRETVESEIKKDAKNVIFIRCFADLDSGWKEKEYGKSCFYSIENYRGWSSLMTTRIRHIR